MQRDRRAPYNPYHDWRVPAGSATFVKLCQTEEHFKAEVLSKEPRYHRFREFAVQFIENQSRSFNFDALIPYMAMTYVDRFRKAAEIPKVFRTRKKNEELFLICCLTIAWKLRTKTFELPGFLNTRKLKYSEENVLDMEFHICIKLEWRMLTLTPFRFVEFLVPFLTLPPGSTSPVRSVSQLIIKSQFDIAFTEFKSSVLAVSAMLTVSSKMFPAQFQAFETHIITSDFIDRDMVYKCKEMLAPLYRQPEEPAASAERKPAEPKADPGEASSSVVRKQSSPIPVPGRGTPTTTETQTKKTEMSEALFLASLPPGVNVEEERQRFAREKQAFEAEKNRGAWTHRIGKEPEITEESYEPVGADSDELMNFELGWIEAQADAAVTRGLSASFGAYLGQRLTGCCSSNPLQRCNIL